MPELEVPDLDQHPLVLFFTDSTHPHIEDTKSITIRQRCLALLVFSKCLQADPRQSDDAYKLIGDIARACWDENLDSAVVKEKLAGLQDHYLPLQELFIANQAFLEAIVRKAPEKELVDDLECPSIQFDAMVLTYLQYVNKNTADGSLVFDKPQSDDASENESVASVNRGSAVPANVGRRPRSVSHGSISEERVYPKAEEVSSLSLGFNSLSLDLAGSYQLELLKEKKRGSLNITRRVSVDFSKVSLSLESNCDVIAQAMFDVFGEAELAQYKDQSTGRPEVLAMTPDDTGANLIVLCRYTDADGADKQVAYKLPMPDFSPKLKFQYGLNWWDDASIILPHVYQKNALGHVMLTSLDGRGLELQSVPVLRDNLPLVTGLFLREFGEAYVSELLQDDILHINHVGECFEGAQRFICISCQSVSGHEHCFKIKLSLAEQEALLNKDCYEYSTSFSYLGYSIIDDGGNFYEGVREDLIAGASYYRSILDNALNPTEWRLGASLVPHGLNFADSYSRSVTLSEEIKLRTMTFNLIRNDIDRLQPEAFNAEDWYQFLVEMSDDSQSGQLRMLKLSEQRQEPVDKLLAVISSPGRGEQDFCKHASSCLSSILGVFQAEQKEQIEELTLTDAHNPADQETLAAYVASANESIPSDLCDDVVENIEKAVCELDEERLQFKFQGLDEDLSRYGVDRAEVLKHLNGLAEFGPLFGIAFSRMAFLYDQELQREVLEVFNKNQRELFARKEASEKKQSEIDSIIIKFKREHEDLIAALELDDDTWSALGVDEVEVEVEVGNFIQSADRRKKQQHSREIKSLNGALKTLRESLGALRLEKNSHDQRVSEITADLLIDISPETKKKTPFLSSASSPEIVAMLSSARTPLDNSLMLMSYILREGLAAQPDADELKEALRKAKCFFGGLVARCEEFEGSKERNEKYDHSLLRLTEADKLYKASLRELFQRLRFFWMDETEEGRLYYEAAIEKFADAIQVLHQEMVYRYENSGHRFKFIPVLELKVDDQYIFRVLDLGDTADKLAYESKFYNAIRSMPSLLAEQNLEGKRDVEYYVVLQDFNCSRGSHPEIDRALRESSLEGIYSEEDFPGIFYEQTLLRLLKTLSCFCLENNALLSSEFKQKLSDLLCSIERVVLGGLSFKDICKALHILLGDPAFPEALEVYRKPLIDQCLILENGQSWKSSGETKEIADAYNASLKETNKKRHALHLMTDRLGYATARKVTYHSPSDGTNVAFLTSVELDATLSSKVKALEAFDRSMSGFLDLYQLPYERSSRGFGPRASLERVGEDARTLCAGDLSGLCKKSQILKSRFIPPRNVLDRMLGKEGKNSQRRFAYGRLPDALFESGAVFNVERLKSGLSFDVNKTEFQAYKPRSRKPVFKWFPFSFKGASRKKACELILSEQGTNSANELKEEKGKNHYYTRLSTEYDHLSREKNFKSERLISLVKSEKDAFDQFWMLKAEILNKVERYQQTGALADFFDYVYALQSDTRLDALQLATIKGEVGHFYQVLVNRNVHLLELAFSSSGAGLYELERLLSQNRDKALTLLERVEKYFGSCGLLLQKVDAYLRSHDHNCDVDSFLLVLLGRLKKLTPVTNIAQANKLEEQLASLSVLKKIKEAVGLASLTSSEGDLLAGIRTDEQVLACLSVIQSEMQTLGHESFDSVFVVAFLQRVRALFYVQKTISEATYINAIKAVESQFVICFRRIADEVFEDGSTSIGHKYCLLHTQLAPLFKSKLMQHIFADRGQETAEVASSLQEFKKAILFQMESNLKHLENAVMLPVVDVRYKLEFLAAIRHKGELACFGVKYPAHSTSYINEKLRDLAVPLAGQETDPADILLFLRVARERGVNYPNVLMNLMPRILGSERHSFFNVNNARSGCAVAFTTMLRDGIYCNVEGVKPEIFSARDLVKHFTQTLFQYYKANNPCYRSYSCSNYSGYMVKYIVGRVNAAEAATPGQRVELDEPSKGALARLIEQLVEHSNIADLAYLAGKGVLAIQALVIKHVPSMLLPLVLKEALQQNYLADDEASANLIGMAITKYLSAPNVAFASKFSVGLELLADGLRSHGLIAGSATHQAVCKTVYDYLAPALLEGVKFDDRTLDLRDCLSWIFCQAIYPYLEQDRSFVESISSKVRVYVELQLSGMLVSSYSSDVSGLKVLGNDLSRLLTPAISERLTEQDRNALATIAKMKILWMIHKVEVNSDEVFTDFYSALLRQCPDDRLPELLTFAQVDLFELEDLALHELISEKLVGYLSSTEGLWAYHALDSSLLSLSQGNAFKASFSARCTELAGTSDGAVVLSGELRAGNFSQVVRSVELFKSGFLMPHAILQMAKEESWHEACLLHLETLQEIVDRFDLILRSSTRDQVAAYIKTLSERWSTISEQKQAAFLAKIDIFAKSHVDKAEIFFTSVKGLPDIEEAFVTLANREFDWFAGQKLTGLGSGRGAVQRVFPYSVAVSLRQHSYLMVQDAEEAQSIVRGDSLLRTLDEGIYRNIRSSSLLGRDGIPKVEHLRELYHNFILTSSYGSELGALREAIVLAKVNSILKEGGNNSQKSRQLYELYNEIIAINPPVVFASEDYELARAIAEEVVKNRHSEMDENAEKEVLVLQVFGFDSEFYLEKLGRDIAQPLSEAQVLALGLAKGAEAYTNVAMRSYCTRALINNVFRIISEHESEGFAGVLTFLRERFTSQAGLTSCLPDEAVGALFEAAREKLFAAFQVKEDLECSFEYLDGLLGDTPIVVSGIDLVGSHNSFRQLIIARAMASLALRLEGADSLSADRKLYFNYVMNSWGDLLETKVACVNHTVEYLKAELESISEHQPFTYAAVIQCLLDKKALDLQARIDLLELSLKTKDSALISNLLVSILEYFTAANSIDAECYKAFLLLLDDHANEDCLKAILVGGSAQSGFDALFGGVNHTQDLLLCLTGEKRLSLLFLVEPLLDGEKYQNVIRQVSLNRDTINTKLGEVSGKEQWAPEDLEYLSEVEVREHLDKQASNELLQKLVKAAYREWSLVMAGPLDEKESRQQLVGLFIRLNKKCSDLDVMKDWVFDVSALQQKWLRVLKLSLSMAKFDKHELVQNNKMLLLYVRRIVSATKMGIVNGSLLAHLIRECYQLRIKIEGDSSSSCFYDSIFSAELLGLFDELRDVVSEDMRTMFDRLKVRPAEVKTTFHEQAVIDFDVARDSFLAGAFSAVSQKSSKAFENDSDLFLALVHYLQQYAKGILLDFDTNSIDRFLKGRADLSDSKKAELSALVGSQSYTSDMQASLQSYCQSSWLLPESALPLQADGEKLRALLMADEHEEVKAVVGLIEANLGQLPEIIGQLSEAQSGLSSEVTIIIAGCRNPSGRTAQRLVQYFNLCRAGFVSAQLALEAPQSFECPSIALKFYTTLLSGRGKIKVEDLFDFEKTVGRQPLLLYFDSLGEEKIQALLKLIGVNRSRFSGEKKIFGLSLEGFLVGNLTKRYPILRDDYVCSRLLLDSDEGAHAALASSPGYVSLYKDENNRASRWEDFSLIFRFCVEHEHEDPGFYKTVLKVAISVYSGEHEGLREICYLDSLVRSGLVPTSHAQAREIDGAIYRLRAVAISNIAFANQPEPVAPDSELAPAKEKVTAQYLMSAFDFSEENLDYFVRLKLAFSKNVTLERLPVVAAVKLYLASMLERSLLDGVLDEFESLMLLMVSLADKINAQEEMLSTLSPGDKSSRENCSTMIESFGGSFLDAKWQFEALLVKYQLAKPQVAKMSLSRQVLSSDGSQDAQRIKCLGVVLEVLEDQVGFEASGIFLDEETFVTCFKAELLRLAADQANHASLRLLQLKLENVGGWASLRPEERNFKQRLKAELATLDILSVQDSRPAVPGGNVNDSASYSAAIEGAGSHAPHKSLEDFIRSLFAEGVVPNDSNCDALCEVGNQILDALFSARSMPTAGLSHGYTYITESSVNSAFADMFDTLSAEGGVASCNYRNLPNYAQLLAIIFRFAVYQLARLEAPVLELVDKMTVFLTNMGAAKFGQNAEAADILSAANVALTDFERGLPSEAQSSSNAVLKLQQTVLLNTIAALSLNLKAEMSKK